MASEVAPVNRLPKQEFWTSSSPRTRRLGPVWRGPGRKSLQNWNRFCAYASTISKVCLPLKTATQSSASSMRLTVSMSTLPSGDSLTRVFMQRPRT